MSNATSLFDNSELALASYSALGQGDTANQRAALTQATGAQMSLTQATEFALRYPTVVTQFNDTAAEGGLGTSFSVTVFKDTTGNVTVAFRGTLELTGTPNDLAPTDANIFANGAGYDQIVAMYNWWQRVATPAGQTVAQYQIVPYATTVTPPLNATFLYQGPGVFFYLEPAPNAVASGSLLTALSSDADGKVDLTGHSLGGHLALAFNTLFPGVVNQVTVFNTPGFTTTTTNQQFFSRLGGVIPTSANSGNVTNVIADEASIGSPTWSAIAGWNSRPGVAVNVAMENQVLSDEPDKIFNNHSQAALTDSLAVYRLLTKLDPNLSLPNYKTILNQMVRGTAASYEGIVDALEALFGLNRDPLPTGNNQRNALYEAIYGLQANATFTTLSGNLGLSVLSSLTVAQIIDKTSDANLFDKLAYRYALKELNPFAVIGSDALYAPHNSNGELNLYNPADRSGTLTTEWLADRAAFLAWKNIANANDVTALSNNLTTEMSRFIDLPQNINLTVIPQGAGAPIDAQTRRFIFGGDGADNLQGGAKSDRLYGGAGADYLAGKADADYLEGGTGLDIYEYKGYAGIFTANNDGADTILDIDGKGVLRYVYNDNPTPISTVIAEASVKVSDIEWRSADGKFTYTKSGADLVITINDFNDPSITLKDWREGDFNIYLRSARVNPQTTNTINTPDTQIDGFNYFFDTVNNDRITGGEGNDSLRGPLDLGVGIFSGSGQGRGDDWFSGGSGRDDLSGGPGKNLLEGGADGILDGDIGGDVVIGGSDDDELYGDGKLALTADPNLVLSTAITQGATGLGTLLKGDFLSGASGEDWILGADGKDYLDGGAGKDLLIGGRGDDNILGDGGYGTDRFSWAITRETPSATSSKYKLKLEFVAWAIDGIVNDGADVIYGGAGDDWIWAGGGNDFVDAGNDNDVVFGHAGDDVLIGGAGNDVLGGDGGADQGLAAYPYFGGEFVDFVPSGSVGEGDDYLDGGAGNDLLLGHGGSDVLIGGAGNDTLRGGAGKDIYVFRRGDGVETVFDTDASSNSPDASVLILEGVNRADIKFRVGSLLVDIGNGDQIHFDGFDQVNPTATTALGEIHLADGTSMSYADILAQGFDIDGTEDDDNNNIPTDPRNLVGTGVTDRIRGLGGNDLIFGLAGDDVLNGGTGADTLVGGAGVDMLYGEASADQLVGEDGDDFLYGGDDNDTLFGDVGNDLILGGSGDDQLVGGTGDDTLDGGAGNDNLFGQAGNDVYVFGRGYGVDLISDEDTTPGNVDVVQLAADITPDQVSVVASLFTDSLDLVIDGTTDRLILGNQTSATIPLRIEEIRFADGTVWTPATTPTTISGSSSNDVLNGTSGADIFKSGAGSDVMAGGAGNDSYRYSRGDGADYIIDSDATAGNTDKIVFAANILPADVRATRSGNNLYLTINALDLVVVEDYFLNDGVTPKSVEQVKFLSDGTVWDVNTVKQLVLAGTPGNDALTGYATADNLAGLAGNDVLVGNAGDDTLDGGIGNDNLQGGTGNDTYLFARGDGQDVITDSDATAGNVDTLRFAADMLPTDITATRSVNDLTLNINGSADQVLITNYFLGGATGANHVERIEFTGNGTVWLYADVLAIAQSVITGTAGADNLTGTADDDVILGMAGNDAIDGLGGNDSIDGGADNDSLQGNAGNDTLLGGAGRDTIFGGQGNDVLDARGATGVDGEIMSGGAGSDTYKFGHTARQTSVSDTGGTGYAGDTDTILIDADILPSQLLLKREGGNGANLTLSIAGEATATLTVNNHFLLDGHGADSSERIQFLSDGTVWDVETINSMVSISTEGNDFVWGFEGRNDLLFGLGGTDSVNGLGGADTLNGGPGVDFLNGGSGNDTYLFNIGDQDEFVNEYTADNSSLADFDIVQFGAGISGLYFLPSGVNDLSIYLNSALTGDHLTVSNFFANDIPTVEEFHFGSVLTAQDFANLTGRTTLNGTSGNDSLQGGKFADTISGAAGSDTLRGGNGNDSIDGGLGGDQLFGEGGNDLLIAGAGEASKTVVTNMLYGGNGADILVASGKTDTLYGESGNDLSLGAAGVDTIQETAGGNMLLGAAGADVLRAGDGNDLAIGGVGNETIDGDFDANGVRGRDILAFNKSDGIDTTSRLGANSTISIGGGTLYSNLSFAISGNDLRLKTGSSHYVTLTNWYGGEKNVSTLQIVIEGTRDYNAGSANPLNNKKIQTFDFLGLVTAWDAAGRPNNFSIANNLAAYRIGGSDTDMIGGAIAYQYARSGNLGTLTYSQMQAVINDPNFGIAAQSITPVAALAAEEAAASETSAELAAESLRVVADSDESDALTIVISEANDAAAPSDNPSLPDQAATAAADHSAPAAPPIPDGVALPEVALAQAPVFLEYLVPQLPQLPQAPQAPASPVAANAAGVSALSASHGGAAAAAGASATQSSASTQSSTAHNSPPPSTAGEGAAPATAAMNDAAKNGQSAAGQAEAGARQADNPVSDESGTLAAQWFDRSAQNDDLTLLDDTLRGDTAANTASPDAIAAEWERTHQWLSRYANAHNGAGDSGADGADLSGLSYLGLDDTGFDMPRAVVGLRGVAGHEMKAFKGLQEGVKVLGML